MTTRDTAPARRRRVSLGVTFGIVVVLLIGFFLFAGLYTDALWFDQLGYLGVLITEWVTIATLFVVGFLGMAVPVFVSIQLAYRLRPVYAKLTAQLDRYQQVIEPLRRVVMVAIPIVIGLFAAVSAATRWQPVLLFLHAQHVGGKPDPVFGLDLGFYLFQLPVLHGLVGFVSAAVVISGIAAVATTYLYGAVRIVGREVRVSRAARVQISITIAVYLLVQAVSLILDRFMTLYGASSGGYITGAGYTDVHAVIPSRLILAVICVLVAALFVVTGFVGRWRLPLVGTGVLVVGAVLIGSVYPWVQQNFQVHPSPLSYEAKYFDDAIKATRSAYGIAGTKVEPYDATTTATPGALRSDADTTAQIRIIDPDVVSPTFGQFQKSGQFYSFGEDLDVDRYDTSGTTQDAVVGVRELDQDNISNPSAYASAFQYTHGYGLVAAAGNKRDADGSPTFIEGSIPEKGLLGVTQPRVYFGEGSPAYSVVGAPKGTNPVEVDYPTSGGTAKTTYTGKGGPNIGSFFNRLVYALKFQSDQILLSNSVNDDSQILYDRDPIDRVQKVAPYLTLDSDPYPTVVNGHVTWVVDGYTTSSTYPYSTQQSLSGAIQNSNNGATPYATDQVNYIRNSVKATVDAYTGKVTLYAWDSNDPVLKAWEHVFPATVHPMADMPSQLIAHVRYPQDLFKVQRFMLGAFHVQDPTAWFNGSEQWRTPTDPTASSSSQNLQPPYYLTMKVPGRSSPSYSLYSTFIPDQNDSKAQSILRGYIVADSDAGSTAGEKSADYGQLRLLELPTGTEVPAPSQAESTIVTTYASQLGLLNRADTSSVIKGNLLTLPVGGGFLYVEPIYLKSATGASYPLLRDVAVVFGSDTAFEPTLDAALNDLFGGNSGANAGDSGVSGSGSGSGSGTGSGSGSGTGGSSTGKQSAALKKALADAETALKARQADYAKGDLVGAAQQDEALQKALEDAIAAGG